MKIELHPEADDEFTAQIWYFEDRQEGLGQRSLTGSPRNPTLPRLRKYFYRVNLKVFPFYIAYVVKEDLIWVLAVAHVKRKPEYWRNRLRGG